MGTILIANYSLAVLCLERVGKKLLLGKNNRQCNLSSKWKDSFGKNVKKPEKRENILNNEESHIPKERLRFYFYLFSSSFLVVYNMRRSKLPSIYQKLLRDASFGHSNAVVWKLWQNYNSDLNRPIPHSLQVMTTCCFFFHDYS